MAINYAKVGWDTTKYVNPTNMNHMDEGIKAACDKADANEAAIADVNNNLEYKINKNDIISKSETRKNKPWLVLKDYIDSNNFPCDVSCGYISCGLVYSYEGYLSTDRTYGSWVIHGSDGLVCHAYLSDGTWYYPDLQAEISKINSSFVSSDQGTLAGLVKTGQMWLIIAQRITVPDSAMFIAHGWNDEVYIKPIYKDSSIDYYVNNQGTITVTYGGDAGNVLISAIRLH